MYLKRAALHKNYTRSTDRANIQVKLLIYIEIYMKIENLYVKNLSNLRQFAVNLKYFVTFLLFLLGKTAENSHSGRNKSRTQRSNV